VYAAPVVADGCVLAGSYDGNVYCFNASDGSETWRFHAGVLSPIDAGGSAGSPVIVEGVVYVVGNGSLYALGVSQKEPFSLLIVVEVGVAALVIVAVALALVYRKRHQTKI
jgi:outer membrane protein assembly factor BamB